MLGLKIQTPAPPEFRPAACAGSAWRVLPARAPCVCGLNDELRVPGSCESECGLGLGVAGACVEFPLSRELPLPRSLLPPSSFKVWRAAKTGKIGGRTAGRPCPGLGGDSGTPAPYLPRPPSLLRRGRIRLSAAGVRRGQHPLATLPSLAQDAAKEARSLRSLAARALRPPGRRWRRLGGREGGAARPVRTPSGKRRQAGAVLRSERASGPAWRPPHSGPSRRAAGGGGGGFLNRVQGARGALLLLLSFLSPPSSQHSAPGNLGTVGEVGSARAERRPGLWVEGGEEREELSGKEGGPGGPGARPRPRGAARSRTPLWAFVPGAAPPPTSPGIRWGAAQISHPLQERLGGAPVPGWVGWGRDGVEIRAASPCQSLPSHYRPAILSPQRDPSGCAGSRPRAGLGKGGAVQVMVP